MATRRSFFPFPQTLSGQRWLQSWHFTASLLLLGSINSSLLHRKTQDFPCSLFPLHAFLLASPSPVAFDPWFTFLRAAAPRDLSRVPASGSVPPLGRYGTLQPTTSSTETVPGVVYWLRSSILSLHNYGVSMQGRGEKICSTSMLQFKVTAICIMPERQGIEEKENIRMLFLLFPNILGYKDQTNYQTVLS